MSENDGREVRKGFPAGEGRGGEDAKFLSMGKDPEILWYLLKGLTSVLRGGGFLGGLMRPGKVKNLKKRREGRGRGKPYGKNVLKRQG